MKTVLLNGSPRKGNTYTALEALKKGLANIDGLEIVEINATKAKILPCVACKACKKIGKCAFPDDSDAIVEEIVQADFLTFALPVYWWGIPAQLKLIIDKFYSKADRLAQSRKRVGILMVGQLATDNLQYELIRKQIECISDYLGWKVVFSKTYSAYNPGDLVADPDALQEIGELWKTVAL